MTALKAYIVTFNCGREPIQPQTFASHLFSALPKSLPAPDILVLCLQELAPLAYSFLGGSYLLPYLSPFRRAVTIGAESLDNASYVNIITRNLGMTAIMVFILRDQTAQVRWLETAGVGVGLQEMGNKGAVGIRMGYSMGEEMLDMTFVSAHLAAMEDAFERRNEDWANIVRGLVFVPVSPTTVRKTTKQRLPQESSNASETEPLLDAPPEAKGDSIPPMSGIYTPTSHLFLAGDLNYRTSSTKPTVNAYLTWPQPTKDPKAPEHFSHLLASDQLTRELRAGRTLHGLQEAPIDFPPTYKYSNHARKLASTQEISNDSEPETWDWAKHRYPSWCDRILYLPLPPWMAAGPHALSHKIHTEGYKALPLMATSDHRPVACSIDIPAEAIPEPSAEEEEENKEDVRLVPPFELDARWRERRETARVKEVVVGLVCYMSLTWEGRGMLIAVLIGALGGWAVVGSLLDW
ncbi:hypothetical protein N7G274_003503 [Stereocaulon virgatum]|uniref:Inositol polyphosphate-related phosphatase domain-containing protein n=1 Tax=Stereocaulon virgatum TaxID=373712 RepID=A0ABR4AFW9_9LECA